MRPLTEFGYAEPSVRDVNSASDSRRIGIDSGSTSGFVLLGFVD